MSFLKWSIFDELKGVLLIILTITVSNGHRITDLALTNAVIRHITCTAQDIRISVSLHKYIGGGQESFIIFLNFSFFII